MSAPEFQVANAAFGIDHPLIAVHDIERLRALLISLGFNMTPVGRHPWGTSTSLAMFNGCLVEIIGIHDESLVDEVPAGRFRFGRHVLEHLQVREGVALTALHSQDSKADADVAVAAGRALAGHLEFGRDVKLPDGRADRTRTTLALLPDVEFPRLSFFLCQQHRPELIYVPQWMAHPNTACGIAGVEIVASTAQQDRLAERFKSLYGEPGMIMGGCEFQTANGRLALRTVPAFCEVYGPLPDAVVDDQPGIVAMDIGCGSLEQAHACVESSGQPFVLGNDTLMLIDAGLTGNVYLRFVNDQSGCAT